MNIKDIEVLAIREDGGAMRLGLETPEDVQEAAGILRSAGFDVVGRA